MNLTRLSWSCKYAMLEELGRTQRGIRGCQLQGIISKFLGNNLCKERYKEIDDERKATKDRRVAKRPKKRAGHYSIQKLMVGFSPSDERGDCIDTYK